MGVGTVITRNRLNAGETAGIALIITEKGNTITPDSITWTLTNKDREIVNDREDVDGDPGNPTIFQLDPEDTIPADTKDRHRYLTVEARYTSRILSPGEDCALRRQWRLAIVQLTGRTRIKINGGESAGIAVPITENKVEIEPISVAWTLKNGAGEIVNGRDQEPVTPGKPTIIRLDPEDTQTASGKDELRYLAVHAEYTSNILSGPLELESGEIFELESGEAFLMEGGGANCVLNRRWRFVVKGLKEPL